MNNMNKDNGVLASSSSPEATLSSCLLWEHEDSGFALLNAPQPPLLVPEEEEEESASERQEEDKHIVLHEEKTSNTGASSSSSDGIHMVEEEQGADDNTAGSLKNNNNDSNMSNSDTEDNINDNKIAPFAAKTITTGRFYRQQRRARKLVRKTKRRLQIEASDQQAYHDDRTTTNNNNAALLLLPTSVVVGAVLGIVLAFGLVSLRHAAVEIAELRSTVLELQSKVLDLQSTTHSSLRKLEMETTKLNSLGSFRQSSTIAMMIQELQSSVLDLEEKIESTNHGRRSNHHGTSTVKLDDDSATEVIAEVKSKVEQTGRTMEQVVEALVNLDRTVYQLESKMMTRGAEEISEQFIVNNESSSSPTTTTTTTVHTLNFDDRALTTDFDQLPDGYHGLGFTNIWTASPHLMMNENDCISKSGLVQGTISHPSVAVNAYGEPASIRAMDVNGNRGGDDDNISMTSISVSSLVATPVGRNNVQLNIEGLRGSTVVRATMVTLRSTQHPTVIDLDGFEDLTEIRLDTIGGEFVSEDCQCSPIVAYDDIVYRIHHHHHH